jgi:hypothetical protein
MKAVQILSVVCDYCLFAGLAKKLILCTVKHKIIV